jgi:hypothetical protein
MKEKCPRGYTVLKEEEVVVGQVQHTHVNTAQSGNPTLAALHLDKVNTQTNETTSFDDKKEWRITFCAAGATPTVVALPGTEAGAFVPLTPPPGGLPAQPTPVGR